MNARSLLALCIMVASLPALGQEGPVLKEGQADVGTLVDALAPGSCLVLSCMTADFEPEQVHEGIAAYKASGVTLVARDQAQVGRFFKGLDLLEPGIVSVRDWRPELAEGESDLGPGPVSLYGAVGIKP